MISTSSTDRTTVVVITCNYGRFLAAAVGSAVGQTCRPRVRIMDDASVDGTEALAANLMGQYPGLEYVRSPAGRGLSAIRNDAARTVTTDWIVYLDADDWLDPWFIERGERWLDDHPGLDVLTTDMTVVRTGRRPYLSKARAPGSWRDLTRRNTVVQTSFIRREMILALGGYNGTFAYEDWELWIRALKAGYAIGRLPGPHVFRREHGLNKSKTCDEALATRQVRERHPLDPRGADLISRVRRFRSRPAHDRR